MAKIEGQEAGLTVQAPGGAGAAIFDPRQVGSPQMVAIQRQTSKEAYDAWLPRLGEVLELWITQLPEEAATNWRRGLVYVRESSPNSLAKSAPDVQLKKALAIAFRKQIYIAAEDLFFDVESGTDIAPRRAFRRLMARCLQPDGAKAVVVAADDRMFRNMTQAKEIGREFIRNGIDFFYEGMYEGDARDPAKFMHESIQQMFAENHARNTSWMVGRHFETLSRDGRPIGRIPEVFVPETFGPAVLGRPGSILTWRLQEPLASILRQGMQLYLGGMSFREVAEWSVTTELRGVTPKGAQMRAKWWHEQLGNPKHAGYQVPTNFKGFPAELSKEQKKRRRTRGVGLELVPSVLPALWTLETYQELLACSTKRWRGPKRRGSYRTYLLSGVAYDAECGHRMMLTGIRKPDGRFWMVCGQDTAAGRHSSRKRADIAEQELDALLSRVRFDDPTLIAQIEDELRRLEEDARGIRQRFKPNPKIATVRQAIAILLAGNIEGGRAELERQVADLEAADQERLDAMYEPVVVFQRAVAALKTWPDVWASADIFDKNKLLRSAGVRVELGRLPNERRKQPPMHVLSITAQNPAMAMALGVALANSQDMSGFHPDAGLIPPITLKLGEGPWATASTRASLTVIKGSLTLARPLIASPLDKRRPPKPLLPQLPLGGPWFTPTEFAARVGVHRSTVSKWVRDGRVVFKDLSRAGSKRHWYVIHERELDRLTPRVGLQEAA